MTKLSENYSLKSMYYDNTDLVTKVSENYRFSTNLITDYNVYSSNISVVLGIYTLKPIVS